MFEPISTRIHAEISDINSLRGKSIATRFSSDWLEKRKGDQAGLAGHWYLQN